MDKKVYMEKLFSNTREKLIDKCIEIQRCGKKFIYIMPSSAALFQVRNRFMEANKGFLGSRVIVFDDLEIDIVKNSMPREKIIYEPIDRVIIAEKCSRLKDAFKYYGNIYDKIGFHREITAFIRTLKRSCINEDTLFKTMNNMNDEVLRDKLNDLFLIYKEYNNSLKDNGIYDRNDISIKAADLAYKYNELNKIDTIVIDGFTDIEKVSMKLIEKIAELNKSNIYINCPYENKFMKGFLDEEIKNPFEALGFEILREDRDIYNVQPWVSELSNKFYSGEKVNECTTGLRIKKYPCIEAEVRETARSIKKRIMDGEKPEEIAVYINNKDDYSQSMHNVFKEFNIPLSMAYELPLGDSELVRKTIKDFENREEQTLTAEKWIMSLKDEVANKDKFMVELLERTLNSESDFADKLEVKAFDALKNLVDETRLSFEKSSMAKGKISRENFTKYMLEGITSAKVTIEQGNNSGVRVMDTALAKGVYYNHIYVMGLNEGEIPAIIKNNGLFDEYEVSDLLEHGIRYRDYLWELTREKIRFNLSLSSARESITLCYRGADEEGKFAIASPFIDEIKYLCSIEDEGIDEWSMRDRFQLTFDDVMSHSELKSSYIENYFENKYKGLNFDELKNELSFISNHSKDIDEIIKSGTVEHHRENKAGFNEYEGIMTVDFSEIADSICKFTPSAINTYLDCPFKYLVSQLYKPGEQEEEAEEFSMLEIGDFYHKVLYKYYNNVKQFTAFDEELYDKFFDEAYADLRLIDVDPEDKKMKKTELYNTLKNFINIDIERLKQFEKQTKGNILRPILLETMAEDTAIFGVNIKCKIDRADAEYKIVKDKMVPTGRYVIYDYKKKTIKGINEILNNTDYQLPIYYYLIEKELKKKLNLDSLECMALLYLSIEKTEDKMELAGIYKTEFKKALGINKRGDIKADNFMELMKYIKGQILETIALIKSGRFNYKPMCSNFEGYTTYSCEYEKLCRYSKNKMRVMAEEGL